MSLKLYLRLVNVDDVGDSVRDDLRELISDYLWDLDAR